MPLHIHDGDGKPTSDMLGQRQGPEEFRRYMRMLQLQKLHEGLT